MMPEKRQRPSAFGRESGNCRAAEAAKQKIDVNEQPSPPTTDTCPALPQHIHMNFAEYAGNEVAFSYS
ncbi:hypothetical protein KI429_03250 [Pseudomonas shirazica]|nr:hypothetical protein KI429_03250 [Pseudomonas shirazica]